MSKINISIEGMSCSACSNGLEKYLNKQNGIKKAVVNLVMCNAVIEYENIDIKTIEKYIKEAGFTSTGIYKTDTYSKKMKFDKKMIIVFSLLTILILYISMSHMIHLPVISFLNMKRFPINFGISLLFLVIPFLIYGFDILKSGYKNLIHKMPNMDTLVSIGIVSSLIYSIYNLILIVCGYNDNVEFLYFDAVATIIFFVKLGRFIDYQSKNKTREAVKKLVQITPSFAVIVKDGKEIKVTIDEIKKGDIVISKPGDRISVDGVIIKGQTHVDESFITGESKPILKEINSKVIAGSYNYDGYIEYSAQNIGKDSTISSIVNLVIEATNTKAPIAKVADVISGYFVPVIFIIAVLSFIIYLILGYEFSSAINTFVTVLVVACPCALGLSTPLAIVVGEGLCAQKGILVKTSTILENSNKVDTIVFDKTGTLTYGELKINKLFNYSNMNDNSLLQIVGSIESKSTHPIASAFNRFLIQNKINELEINKFLNLNGYGLEAVIDEKKYYLGNSKLLDKLNIINIHLEDELELSSQGNSIVYVIEENNVIGIVGIKDIIRDNVPQIIKELSIKKEVIMLTGDNEVTANNIAHSIGINNVISNVLPEQKLNVIKKLKEEGKIVMMVGDGINDAPSLALADIGVSVNSGTDIALDSSDVILMNNDLSKIIDLINISRSTFKIIKQNLFWAFFYNIIMIPIAVGLLRGFDITMNPMIAGLAMVTSSLTIILNTLRLIRK